MILNRQPLLILAISFVLGIFFQDYLSFDKNLLYFVLGVLLILSVLLFLNGKFVFKVRNVLLAVVFFGLGIILQFYNSSEVPDFSVNSTETVVFKISKKLNSNEKYKKYEVAAKVGSQNFNAVINMDKDHKELDFLHFYKAKAYIVRAKSPEYDFQFDYSKYLKRKNIFYQCFMNGEILSASRNDLTFAEKIKQKRLETLENINQTSISPRSREFLKGIILADRTEMDAETVSDFNRSGLVHFLAISGTHIVVIFGMFYFLIMRFSSLAFKKLAIVISLVFIWIFAGFIGFGNSVVRSCIMITVYFIYILLQRKPDLLHSMALSVFIILMCDTQQVFDVGFQLSFVAVFGIYWLNQPILKYLPRQDNYLKKILYNTISISIAAQIATLPLVVFYFHQFSLISVIANFAIVPFSEFIIVFSFLMTAIIGLNLNFDWLNTVYDFIIQILLKLIHWFAGFDAVFFENISLTLLEVFMLFSVVYFLRFALKKSSLRTFSNLIIAVFAFLLVRFSLNIYENQKEEFLIHHYKKEVLVSIKKHHTVEFWIRSSAEEKAILQYLIHPYIASRRIKKFKIKTIPASATMVEYRGKKYAVR